MWRHRLILILLATTVSVLPISCNIPDLDQLHLSSCMNTCNVKTKTCLDVNEKKLLSCAKDDSACQLITIHESEACLTVGLDCITACVAEAEATLKK